MKINKEKVLNGVGKTVDVTNDAMEKVEKFIKDNELDIKAKNAASFVVEETKNIFNKVTDKFN